MTITETNDHFEIAFQYKPQLVDLMRALPSRRWDGANKQWVVPLEFRNEVVKLMKHGFEFRSRSGNKVKNVSRESIPDIEPLPELTVDIPLKMSLFPFQRKGVAYAINKRRLIIGDQPGLGKTAQSIATVSALDAFPALVICPSSLKINWKREWEQWTNKRVHILNDASRSTWKRFWDVGMIEVFVTNYESLKKYFVRAINTPDGEKLRLNHIEFKDTVNVFKSIIVDESHRVKSPATQQSKFTLGIARGKENIILLTGTPVVNKPKDLISQLHIIGRLSEFGNYTGFVNRYCSGYKEASNLKELNARLSNSCFYRRDKSDVLKDLPAKMRQIVYCQLDEAHRREYNVAENDLRTYLKTFKDFSPEQIDRSMRGEVMVRISKLKNISARGKINDVCSFIEDVMDSGEKLVMFGHLKEVLGKIKTHFPGSVSITGDDDTTQRQTSIDKFQNDEATQLAVCSIQAGGVGITLTASSRVGFIELHWHPAIHDQCEDRCHRIGQTDSVQCTYFLGKDTIDEWIYAKIESKREMANAIVGSEEKIETDFVNSVIDLFTHQQPAIK